MILTWKQKSQQHCIPVISSSSQGSAWNNHHELRMGAHICNPNTPEAEAGGLPQLRGSLNYRGRHKIIGWEYSTVVKVFFKQHRDPSLDLPPEYM